MAEYYLAKCYHYGFGTARDEGQAQLWFAKSQQTEEGVGLANDERAENARAARALAGIVLGAMDGSNGPSDADKERSRSEGRRIYAAMAHAHGF
jgi:hypothetical protein